MISRDKLSRAPRLVAIRVLGCSQDHLTALVKAGKVRSFRDRDGYSLFDVTGHLDARERRRLQLQGPHRLYWKDDPDALGPPQAAASGRE